MTFYTQVKSNLILQYSIITLVVIGAISVILGTTISRHVRNYLIRSHIEIYPEIVSLAAGDNQTLHAFLSTPEAGPVPHELKRLMNQLLSIGSVFRVKVWGKDGTILWSDETEIIGKSFADNEHFRLALNGTVNYELAESGDAETMTEASKGLILEIYTPVIVDATVAGVLELYEADSDIYDHIQSGTAIVWIIVGISGALLYLLQFMIFHNAYTRQKTMFAQLQETKDVTLFSLALLAAKRDNETGKHLKRTSEYVRLLAEALRDIPNYRSYITDTYIQDLINSAPLHDIGKVGVEDHILKKPGKLTEAEFNRMKMHCEYGAQTLKEAERKLKFHSFLKIAIQMTAHHHEKWNGTGYPEGLKEDEIPLSARIMALADVYDALRSKRVYKEALSHEQSVAIIKQESGHHFDPDIVDAFLKQESGFYEISIQLADTVDDFS